MRKIHVPDFHQSLKEQNNQLRQEAFLFSNENIEDLFKKPAPGKWSVIECFEHINILYQIYLDNLTQGIQKYGERFAPGLYFKPTFIGHYFFLSMAPNRKNKPRFKINTFDRFKPTGHKPESIKQFLRYHSDFEERINQIPNLNLDKIWINSSLGPIMKFKLGDAFRIITGHNHRHLIQAKKAFQFRHA